MNRLNGRVVATTRDGDPGDPLVRALEKEGALVLVWPTLAFASPHDLAALRTAAENLQSYDWVVFTSARGVAALLELVSPAPSDVPVAAVGSTTAASLHARGWTPLVVGRGGASELVAELAAQHDLRGRRVLFPAASRAGPALEESLRACGAVVHRVEAYRTLSTPPDGNAVRADLARGVDVVTFTSPSAVRSLAKGLGDSWPAALLGQPVVAIGATTAEMARSQRLHEVAVAREASLERLVDACVDVLERRQMSCET